MITYTAEQQAAIDAAVADTANTLDGFLTYTWSDRIVERGAQRFAVFDSVARELLEESELILEDGKGSRFEYVPLLVDGRMLERVPDEGRSGIAYLARTTQLRGVPCDGKWNVDYVHTGWLHTHELSLSNQQIGEIIAEEVDRGLDPLGTALPGWTGPVPPPPADTAVKKEGQLWEECERCGREPCYMPLHLCDRCWPK